MTVCEGFDSSIKSSLRFVTFIIFGLPAQKIISGPGLLDIFASGMGSIFARQLKEPYSGTPESMELVEADNVEKMMNVEKLVEIAVKVVWQGISMSAAVSSLAEFAITSADEH